MVVKGRSGAPSSALLCAARPADDPEVQEAQAGYPYSKQVSASWFRLGFPLAYWSDILETLSVLIALGYAADLRLAQAFDWVMDKQDKHGRWKLENALVGKIWYRAKW